jgi:dipeptidyl aminopeptidase/acylaminoacyl peptidase
MRFLLFALLGFMLPCLDSDAVEKQITFAPHGHILTNTGVWSPDSRWIVYDVRSDPAGDRFDSTVIERVNVASGEVQRLFETKNGANCGVATCCPRDDRVVFIQGPEHPDQTWQYSAWHRRGVIVAASRPGIGTTLDARDLVPPFTAGALRGGTHVHTFSGDGQMVAFTYEDHLLQTAPAGTACERNQRNVGVSVAGQKVTVPPSHRRNHDGSHFTVLVTRTEDHPQPGSDEISRAFSDAWVGNDGYIRRDGTRQAKAIALQGEVVTASGVTINEVFIVDLPYDLTQPGQYPLAGTPSRRPHPPRGTHQRRLTHTADRKYPGIQGVRHWLRSSPDGSQIAFLMKDDAGVTQLWTVSPSGGEPSQVTTNSQDVASAFSWSPDGRTVYFVMNQSVCATDLRSGNTVPLTEPRSDQPLRPEACVVSPDGQWVAFVREVTAQGVSRNQIFVAPTGCD